MQMALLTVIHIKKYGDCIFWLAQPLKSVIGIVWTRQLCSRWTTLSEFQDKVNWTRVLQFACVRATQLQSAGGAKIIREASLLSLRSARNILSSCQDQRGKRAWLVDKNKKNEINCHEILICASETILSTYIFAFECIWLCCYSRTSQKRATAV